jgi:hypothetical protein
MRPAQKFAGELNKMALLTTRPTSVRGKVKVTGPHFQGSPLVFGGQAAHEAGHKLGLGQAVGGSDQPLDQLEWAAVMGKNEADLPSAPVADHTLDHGRIAQPPVLGQEADIAGLALPVGKVEVAQKVEQSVIALVI